MFRYRLHLEDGSDAGEACYSVPIRPGEEILVGNGGSPQSLARAVAGELASADPGHEGDCGGDEQDEPADPAYVIVRRRRSSHVNDHEDDDRHGEQPPACDQQADDETGAEKEAAQIAFVLLRAGG
jgi:hypothetical protein